jgi:phenylacetate-coenzyme A ligase PaaK-like adenylate-forming protein
MTTLLSRRVAAHFRRADARRAMLAATTAASWPQRQLRLLQSIWADATADVPYYRQLVRQKRAPAIINEWNDVRAIPVLTRALLQDHAAEFIRDTSRPQSLMKTAGSTGEPLRIGMNQHERDLMRVVKLAEWQSLGYTESSRLFLIWGHGHLLGTGWRGRMNHARRKLTDAFLGYQRVDAYRLDPQSCEEYAGALIRFRPAGLIGYASALDVFASYTEAFRDRFRALEMKFVLSTAEAPPRPDTFARLRDLFGCPVVQEYGGAEFGQAAFDRGAGAFEVYPDLNYLETEAAAGDDPGVQPLLLTSLYQRYVPLIRYRVGDAVSGARRWQNGHVYEFETMAGRINDAIEIRHGVFIHSVAVFHCIHQEPDVLGIQMVLTDQGIELLLIARAAERSAMEARIRGRLAQIDPSLGTARFQYVDDLQVTRAGKRRWYVDRRSTAPCAASPAS